METLTCNTCNLEFTSLKRCSACGLGLYCSKACQVTDWKQHKAMCRLAVDTNIQMNLPVKEKGRARAIKFTYEQPVLIWDLPVECVVNFVATSSNFNDPCPMIVKWTDHGTQYLTIHMSPDQNMILDKEVFRPTSSQLANIPTIQHWRNDMLFLSPQERIQMQNCNPLWIFHFAIITKMQKLTQIANRHIKFARIVTLENMAPVVSEHTNFGIRPKDFDKYVVLCSFFSKINVENGDASRVSTEDMNSLYGIHAAIELLKITHRIGEPLNDEGQRFAKHLECTYNL